MDTSHKLSTGLFSIVWLRFPRCHSYQPKACQFFPQTASQCQSKPWTDFHPTQSVNMVRQQYFIVDYPLSVSGCRPTSGCASDICYNDGVCVESWDREPKCRCTPAYTGQQCQVRSRVIHISRRVFCISQVRGGTCV